jgi:hypothetical protein
MRLINISIFLFDIIFMHRWLIGTSEIMFDSIYISSLDVTESRWRFFHSLPWLDVIAPSQMISL